MQSEIIYEDDDIIVLRKPAGLPTQTSNIRVTDLTDEVKKHVGTGGYIGLINRLDQPVEGIVLVAKREQSAAQLSKQIQNNQMTKMYLAVVLDDKKLPEQGILTDDIIEDKKQNCSYIVDAAHPIETKIMKPKKAELRYTVLERREGMALLKIQLKTGRHHQIRLQMSHAGAPLLGDQKYGTITSRVVSEQRNVKNAALCAFQLQFKHPKTGENVRYEITPSSEVFHYFKSL